MVGWTPRRSRASGTPRPVATASRPPAADVGSVRLTTPREGPFPQPVRADAVSAVSHCPKKSDTAPLKGADGFGPPATAPHRLPKREITGKVTGEGQRQRKQYVPPPGCSFVPRRHPDGERDDASPRAAVSPFHPKTKGTAENISTAPAPYCRPLTQDEFDAASPWAPYAGRSTRDIGGTSPSLRLLGECDEGLPMHSSEGHHCTYHSAIESSESGLFGDQRSHDRLSLENMLRNPAYRDAQGMPSVEHHSGAYRDTGSSRFAGKGRHSMVGAVVFNQAEPPSDDESFDGAAGVGSEKLTTMRQRARWATSPSKKVSHPVESIGSGELGFSSEDQHPEAKRKLRLANEGAAGIDTEKASMMEPTINLLMGKHRKQTPASAFDGACGNTTASLFERTGVREPTSVPSDATNGGHSAHALSLGSTSNSLGEARASTQPSWSSQVSRSVFAPDGSPAPATSADMTRVNVRAGSSSHLVNGRHLNARYYDDGTHVRVRSRGIVECASNIDHLGSSLRPEGDLLHRRLDGRSLPVVYYYQGEQPTMHGKVAAGLETRLQMREQPHFRYSAAGDHAQEHWNRSLVRRANERHGGELEQVLFKGDRENELLECIIKPGSMADLMPAKSRGATAKPSAPKGSVIDREGDPARAEPHRAPRSDKDAAGMSTHVLSQAEPMLWGFTSTPRSRSVSTKAKRVDDEVARLFHGDPARECDSASSVDTPRAGATSAHLAQDHFLPAARQNARSSKLTMTQRLGQAGVLLFDRQTASPTIEAGLLVEHPSTPLDSSREDTSRRPSSARNFKSTSPQEAKAPSTPRPSSSDTRARFAGATTSALHAKNPLLREHKPAAKRAGDTHPEGLLDVLFGSGGAHNSRVVDRTRLAQKKSYAGRIGMDSHTGVRHDRSLDVSCGNGRKIVGTTWKSQAEEVLYGKPSTLGMRSTKSAPVFLGAAGINSAQAASDMLELRVEQNTQIDQTHAQPEKQMQPLARQLRKHRTPASHAPYSLSAMGLGGWMTRGLAPDEVIALEDSIVGKRSLKSNSRALERRS
ncbi:hypothetical protein AB1Y20_020349 [Prymnesium parvum]|uniref:Uncharacterized protein n=1 Tax=Prymnesium parvum TaxID=97485 RepID=A0AB34JWV7_PRYPA